jgi:hypothetical protein
MNHPPTPTSSPDRPARFSQIAAEVQRFMALRTAATDQDAEWQRVHSYIADVLKDAHVLYAKLARLEGDFAGEEAVNLERISEAVLTIGEELSNFSKAFYDGRYSMQQSSFTYGEEGGAPIPAPPPGDEPSGGEPSYDDSAAEEDEKASGEEEKAAEDDEEAAEDYEAKEEEE